MAGEQTGIKFLKFLTMDVVAHTTTSSSFLDENGSAIGLETLRSQYGNNFNTLVVLNLGSVNFDILIDGFTITTVNKSNGSFSFDWKDGINFNRLEFKNTDVANDSLSGDLRITIGRTG